MTSSTPRPSTAQPHVLLLHCHDLGRHLGCYGARTVSAPRLDALAAESVVAEQMFCSAPQCSPSRASMFTGRWPHSNGVLGLTHDGFGWDLNADERHLADRLGAAGYRSELIGMHHESARISDQQVAERLGFDRVQTGGSDREVVERAKQAMDRLASSTGSDPSTGPFYLQVGFSAPHRAPGARDAPGVMGFLGNHIEPDDSLGVEVPRYLADTDSAREEIAELQGAIAHMDDCVGQVLDELDRRGLTDNTITIFVTDHGLALPRSKCSLYDPGMEIAFLIRWPDRGWTGGRLDEVLLNLDIVPTLLDALGLAEQPEQSAGPPLQGRSFRPLLDGDRDALDERSEIFGEITYHDYYDPRRSIRTDRHKLIVNFSSAPTFMDPSQGWVRRCVPVAAPGEPDGRGNLGSHPAVELYDLAADPLELTDLAADPEHATVRDDLLGRLTRWMTDTGDPLLDGAVTSPLHRRSLEMLRQPEALPR
ncbi:sulfatase family protein [Microlunatus soli]|uniref:Arylsulfatase A n=1 Tax=Microlunatus soli TaxID=630515 RepID=A0A1H1V6E2_9ACTN|nr:sulfatase [Microlunatus soli]SDS80061.1 Arylsulfatase A [Microlunatus soli]